MDRIPSRHYYMSLSFSLFSIFFSCSPTHSSNTKASEGQESKLGVFQGTLMSGSTNSEGASSYTIKKTISNGKILLEGIGEVYVHQIQFEKYEGYLTTEIYSKQTSRQTIQGIERFGPFRLYTDIPITSDTTYSANPKIEILGIDNSVVKTIFPLKVFNFFKEDSFKQNKESANDLNNFIVSKSNPERLLDPILNAKNTHFKDEGPKTFNATISYEVENKSLIVNLSYYTALRNDSLSYGFETIVFDSLGNILGHVNGFGPFTNIDLTKDNKYIYINTGGGVTENQFYPYTFSLINLTDGKVIISKKGNSSVCLGGGAIHHTNLGAYAIRTNCNTSYNVKEMYIIDHITNRIYSLHSNKFCFPNKEIRVYNGYCECYGKDNVKTKLFYNKDFSFESFLK